MAKNHAQEMTAQEAWDKAEAESEHNRCEQTGKYGAQYAVYIQDGKLDGAGRPRFSHTGKFVIRTKKKGPIVPNKKSEDPAERLAATLQADGFLFELRPTYWLGEFFRINNIRKKVEAQLQGEAQKVTQSFAAFKKPVAPAPTTEVDKTTVADEATQSPPAEAAQADAPKEPKKAPDSEAKAKEVRSFTERLAAHFNQEKAASL